MRFKISKNILKNMRVHTFLIFLRHHFTIQMYQNTKIDMCS